MDIISFLDVWWNSLVEPSGPGVLSLRKFGNINPILFNSYGAIRLTISSSGSMVVCVLQGLFLFCLSWVWFYSEYSDILSMFIGSTHTFLPDVGNLYCHLSFLVFSFIGHFKEFAFDLIDFLWCFWVLYFIQFLLLPLLFPYSAWFGFICSFSNFSNGLIWNSSCFLFFFNFF